MLVRTFAIFLMLSLMLPSFLKIAHGLQDHVEIHCNDDIPNHFHQAEFDCEFDTIFTFQYTLSSLLQISEPIFIIYKDSNDYSWNTPEVKTAGEIRLRAPPGMPAPRA